MLSLLTGHRSRDWHAKIHAAAASCSITPLDPEFPWDQLNSHTAVYVKRKGKADQQERDTRLRDLIQKHGTLHEGEFVVCVAACAGFMSPEAVRALLADELMAVAGDDAKLIPYLYATTAAHRKNSPAVTKPDLDLAETLIRCYASSGSVTVSQKLEMLFNHLVAGISPDSFAYLRVLALVRQFSKELSSQVQSLRDSCKWLGARAETEWLSRILAQSKLDCKPGCVVVTKLLEETFPDWRKWAEWKPCDTKLAQHLAPFLLPPVCSAKKLLKFFIEVRMAINPESSSYIHEYVCKTIRRSSAVLAKHVAILKASGRWLEAHKETSWLSILLDHSNVPYSAAVDSIVLIEMEFPEWRSWAIWDERDVALAKVLQSCRTLDSKAASQLLKTLILSILDGIRTTSLLYSHVHDSARRLSKDLSMQLLALKANGHWLKAHREVQWLSMLVNPSSERSMTYTEAVRILDEGFVGWEAWAMWRPDTYRLQAQKQLSALQRCSLLELLALEGPDFEYSKQATMREGLLARGHLSSPVQLFWLSAQLTVEVIFAHNARSMLERLSEVVAAACWAGSHAVDLLIHLFYSSRYIDNNALLILEGTIRSEDTMITIDVLDILKAQKKGSITWVTPITRLLPKLSSASNRTLRQALIPRLVEYISTCMREMQALLTIQIDKGTLILELHAFGQSLRTEQWLLPLLDVTLGVLIRGWPTSKKFAYMNALRHDIRKVSAEPATALSLQIDKYYTECFIEAGTIDQETKDLIETLIDLWAKNCTENASSSDRREAALRIAQADKMSIWIRLGCLRQISLLSDKPAADLRQILESAAEEPDKSCVNLARFLVSSLHADHKDLACWSSILFDWCMNRDSWNFKYTTESLKIEEWRQWISDIQIVFPNLDTFDPAACPKAIRPVLQAWVSRISPYTSTIQLVEDIFGMNDPSLCFRVGFESQYNEIIIQVLKLLKDELMNWRDERTLPPAVQASVALLKRDGSNARELHRALSWLSEATTEGNDVYLRIIAIHQGPIPSVTSALLAGWLENPDFAAADKLALESLADLLEIRLSSDTSPDVEAWDAEKYVSRETVALYDEAKRLATLRRSSKYVDSEGVSALCLQLGIDDPSSLEDEIANLPYELLHVVEMVDANTVELSFSVSRFTALKRAGMGTGNAQNLIVRLNLRNGSSPAGFCIHLDNEVGLIAKSGSNSPWLARCKLDNGEGTECNGQMNRATYQLWGIIERHLLSGIEPLEETYKKLKLSLDSMLDSCVACGSPHGVQLHRSSPCKNYPCRKLYVRADPSVVLNDLQEDPQVADLLFTAVQAAISTENIAFLPSLTWFKTFAEVLDEIATNATLSPSDGWSIECSDKFTLPALRYTLLRYEGFLVSATGRLRTPRTPVQIRIPCMPGTYQFLLANAAPHLEKAFATKKGAGPTTVVFHGTSLDRLYAILCQGLKVLSDTPLQKNGAARGKGIYVSEEPRTAWSYATQYKGCLGKGWKSGTFDRFYILLACEATGIVKGQDIHVVKDPSSIILRYIFLTPHGMKAPRAAHIVPAIASVCNSLRSGAL